MADIMHVVGYDLAISGTGDLAVVDSVDCTKQRVLRRLLTNRGGYIWQLNYGAGLGGMVGARVSAQQITALIRSQMKLETAVSPRPEPAVGITSDQVGNLTVSLSYQDVQTGTTQILDIPGRG